MILSGVFTTPPLYSLDPAPDGESETRRLEISFQLFQWIQKLSFKAFQLSQSMKILRL